MAPSQNHYRRFLVLIALLFLTEWKNQVASFAIRSSVCRNHRCSLRMFVDPLPVWRGVKDVLPPIVTGAYEKRTGEEFPAEALYNLVTLPFSFSLL